jgi:hypothetical protein
VAAKGNGYLILDGDEKIVDAAYADKRLSAPANPRWTGDTAEWNAVAGAAGYTVQLYKNETPAGAAVEVSQTSYAFTLTDPGVYTFTVTAKGDGVDSEDSTPADSAKAGDPGKRAIGNTASVTLIPADESGNLTVTPTGTSISKTGGTTSVELKVSPGAGFTDFTWVVDGKSVTGTESGYTLSEDDKTLTIDAAALKLGGHSVTVYAKKDGVPWSPADAVRITVTK